jgi:hypothetical protein
MSIAALKLRAAFSEKPSAKSGSAGGVLISSSFHLHRMLLQPLQAAKLVRDPSSKIGWLHWNEGASESTVVQLP